MTDMGEIHDTFEDELAFALELADLADDISLDLYASGSFEVHRKADSTPVTEADLRIEAMIRRELARVYPHDAILGEEEGATGDSERVWIVDPIDGTKNFTDGVPIWGTLIALQVGGTGVVGVASAPALRERWDAAIGEGARWNGESIQVSDITDMSEAFITYGDLERWLESEDDDVFLALARECRRTRGVGDFWAHLLVASGSADACVERELRTWDWAALDVIVREAGGQFTTLLGGSLRDRGTVLSSNGALHPELVARFTP